MSPQPAWAGASQEDLRHLWGLLVKALLNGLENPPPGGPKAAFMDVVRAFIKDNGLVVETDAAPRQSLAALLRELAKQGPL